MSVPRTIGPYRVEQEIGRGGMGAVYRAHHPQLGRDVAIKLMLNRTDPDSTRRFLVEAQALAQLQHPNVVAIHDAGEHEGQPFLALDWIAGESLKEVLDRDGPLDPNRAAEVVEQLAQALEHAHRRGILHRDLKPANVLVDPTGRALLTDFGLAKDLAREKERLTQTGAVLGTPAFMPPEQADGDPERIDGRADVYGLGATLYALLTGRPPFEGASLMNILSAVLTKRPRPPSQLRPETPRSLETICLKCLEKEPDDRYGSAAALADDLGRFRRQEPILAQPVTWQRKLRLWRRRNARLVGFATWVGGSIAALLVVGLALVELWPRLTYEPSTELKPIQTTTRRTPERPAGLPGRIRDALLLGATASKQKDWKTAVEMLETVLRHPELTVAQRREAADRFAEACRELYYGREADLRHRATLLARLDLALKHRPDDRRCRTTRATVCLRQPEGPGLRDPRLKIAVSDFTELLRDAPDGAHRFQYLLGRGKANRRLARFEEAVEDLTAALELRANSYEALTERGTARRRLGQRSKAIADLEASLKIKRRRLTHLDLAQAYAEHGDHEQARHHARRSIELDDAENVANGKAADPRAHVELAEALRRLKRPAEAERAYLRARRIQQRRREPIDPRISRGLDAVRTSESR